MYSFINFVNISLQILLFCIVNFIYIYFQSFSNFVIYTYFQSMVVSTTYACCGSLLRSYLVVAVIAFPCKAVGAALVQSTAREKVANASRDCFIIVVATILSTTTIKKALAVTSV